MSNITVKFIDREYSVPEDLLVYLDEGKMMEILYEVLC